MKVMTGWMDLPTKRGRGQRRSRRLKNITLDEAQKRARRHLEQNPAYPGEERELLHLWLTHPAAGDQIRSAAKRFFR